MSATLPEVELPDGVRLELLSPVSRRTRNHQPRWDVWLESTRIGLVEQWRTPVASSTTFYRATAIHPESGKPIPLESCTDLRERVEKILAAWNDPERFVHKPRYDWPSLYPHGQP